MNNKSHKNYAASSAPLGVILPGNGGHRAKSTIRSAVPQERRGLAAYCKTTRQTHPSFAGNAGSWTGNPA